MSEIASPIIGGIFTLLGIWLTNYLQNRPKVVQSSPTAVGPSTSTASVATSSIRIGPVIRDVGIIWILTGFAGLVLGMAMGGSDRDSLLAAAGLGNIIFGTIGFIISGSLVKANKWKHLFAVAIGLWLSSFINIFIIGVGVGQWVASLFLVLIMMLVGGLISYIFNRQ